MKKYTISLVIPVYNEAESISRTLKTTINGLSSITDTYEVIIVEDASSDATPRIINQCSQENHKIVPLFNKRNRGSGRSLYLGFKKAKYNLIMSNFADLPFDIKELENILPLLDNDEVDFVVVCRINRRANSFFRKITSLANYWLIRALFNIKVGDFQFVQIYKKNVLDTIDVCSNGTFVAAEIIIKAVNQGFRFKEFYTNFHPRFADKAKCGRPKVILQSVYEIISFWFKCQINPGLKKL